MPKNSSTEGINKPGLDLFFASLDSIHRLTQEGSPSPAKAWKKTAFAHPQLCDERGDGLPSVVYTSNRYNGPNELVELFLRFAVTKSSDVLVSCGKRLDQVKLAKGKTKIAVWSKTIVGILLSGRF